MNIYFVYEINLRPFIFGNEFVPGNSFFGAVKLTINATDFDKYKYFGYTIGFEAHGSFSLSDDSGLVKM